jgi:hypothetical protein
MGRFKATGQSSSRVANAIALMVEVVTIGSGADAADSRGPYSNHYKLFFLLISSALSLRVTTPTAPVLAGNPKARMETSRRGSAAAVEPGAAAF